jgi:hypothetical protein
MHRRVRTLPTVVRCAIVVLCALCGSSALAMTPAVAGPGSSNSEAAACLKRRHLPPYTAYDLGPTFAGLPRTSMARECFAPPHGRLVGTGPRSVAWTSFEDYGTCMPEGSEGGCSDPLEIESWPECDRNFSSYGTAEPPSALPPSTSFRLSGSRKIPTAVFERGRTNRIEMYTGQTTIVIFANGPTDALALRAAHALARIAAPKLSTISAAHLRAAAVSTRGCARR